MYFFLENFNMFLKNILRSFFLGVMSFSGLINSSSQLSFLLLCFIRKTDLGRRKLRACWINFKTKYYKHLQCYCNLVTYFVKISEMAVANLTIIHYFLVESQTSRENIGWTWSIWSSFWIYFDETFCFLITFGKIADWIESEVDNESKKSNVVKTIFKE